jgi:hypothetical protein
MPQNYRGLPANVTFLPPVAVSGTASALSGSAIQIATSSAHGLTTGDAADIYDIKGTIEANVEALITVVDSTHFTIPVAYVNAYVSGGYVQPLTFATAAAQFLDGDTDDAANRAASCSDLAADRTASLLLGVGGYKLVAHYLDWYPNLNAITGNANPTYYWDDSGSLATSTWYPMSDVSASSPNFDLEWPFAPNSSTTGVTNGTTTFTDASAPFSAADVGQWLTFPSGSPIAGSVLITGYTNSTTITLATPEPAHTGLTYYITRGPFPQVPLQVHVGDIVELEFSSSVAYNPGAGGGEAALALFWSTTVGTPSYTRFPGTQSFAAQASGPAVQMPIALHGSAVATVAGPLSVYLAAWNNVATPSGIELYGDYAFTAKVWRATGLPQ